MSNLIRKILQQTKIFTHWEYLIKHNFNLANVMGNSLDLKLEELRLERSELEGRSKTLMQKQRSAESMLTDLTRSIKQMEFDIVQLEQEKTQTIEPQQIEEPQRASKKA